MSPRPSATREQAAPAPEAASVLERLPKVMDALVDLVEQETALVRAGRLADAAQLEPAKDDLAREFLRHAAWLKANREYLPSGLAAEIDALRRKHEVFQALLQINLTVLATAHAVSEGIMRGVSEEMNRRSQPSTYSASGRATAPRPGSAQPLTVSRVL
jgi:hypothetical protein